MVSLSVKIFSVFGILSLANSAFAVGPLRSVKAKSYYEWYMGNIPSSLSLNLVVTPGLLSSGGYTGDADPYDSWIGEGWEASTSNALVQYTVTTKAEITNNSANTVTVNLYGSVLSKVSRSYTTLGSASAGASMGGVITSAYLNPAGFETDLKTFTLTNVVIGPGVKITYNGSGSGSASF